MGNIQILNEKTINQIAAGEVVENPASVVKELIENAIDAGADTITIEILAGGFQLIRIIDNGIGMSQDDAILSIERHATSKLKSVNDFNDLTSMGFRGEALASISSISKMTIVTSNDNEATEVVCEGGIIKKTAPAARVRGTTVDVRSLFYNTPARKKFQKSSSRSMADITKIILKLSLANPQVSINFEGHLKVKGASTTKRIADVLGPNYAKDALEINYDGNIKIQGVIGLAKNSRQNRLGQFLFINQRAVISPKLSFIIKDAYGTRIARDEHPIFALHITIDPSLVDVNVHPQKTEVRFVKTDDLLDAVKSSINKKLNEESTPVFAAPLLKKEETFVLPDIQMPEAPQEFLQPDLVSRTEALDLNIVAMIKHLAVVLPQDGSHYFPISQESGFLLIDLKKVKARVLYDQIYSRLLSKSNTPLECQKLLFPISIDVSVDIAKEMKERLSLYKSLGIDIREFGEKTFIIDGLAPFLSSDNIENLLDELNAAKTHDLTNLALISSSHSSKNSSFYSHAMAKQLIKDLSTCKHPYREKTWVHIDDEVLTRLFKSA